MEEVIVDASEIVAEGGQPVSDQIRDELLEPFITAVCTALGEMAGTEVVVRAVYQKPLPLPPSSLSPDGERGTGQEGDVSAVVELRSATGGSLVLRFPERMAAALAGRILAEVREQADADLIRDCVGEIANVVAGQAKALLAGTSHRFAFSLPKVVAGQAPDLQPEPGQDCLVVNFSSELGDFAMQLFLTR
jgi:chemotaxis protein CheX